jgi:hypothetical protein
MRILIGDGVVRAFQTKTKGLRVSHRDVAAFVAMMEREARECHEGPEPKDVLLDKYGIA